MSYSYGATQHTFDYAHVSTTDQNLTTQVKDLTHPGYTRMFQEKVPGKRTSSPALIELLAAVREGDIVVVNRRGVRFRAIDLGPGGVKGVL